MEGGDRSDGPVAFFCPAAISPKAVRLRRRCMRQIEWLVCANELAQIDHPGNRDGIKD